MSPAENLRAELAEQQKAQTPEDLRVAEADAARKFAERQAELPLDRRVPRHLRQHDQLVAVTTDDVIAACDLVDGPDAVTAMMRKGAAKSGAGVRVFQRVADILYLLSLVEK